MLYLKHTPVGTLWEFVEYLWLLSDTPAHGRERILPTGTLELVINLRGDQIRIYDDGGVRNLPGVVVSGAFAQPFVIDTAAHAFVMGAHFRPGGAFPFLCVGPSELADGHADALGGRRTEELRERLRAAPSHGDRFRILERSLLPYVVDARHAKSRPLVVHAVDRFVRGNASVRSVVAELGISHRHFASVFRDVVGMTPKVFARIQRFQRTLAAVDQRPDWAGLAVTCGYYDQAHLIHEFSAFAGCTPCELLRGRSASLKDHHLLT